VTALRDASSSTVLCTRVVSLSSLQLMRSSMGTRCRTPFHQIERLLRM
jgi:hypothetical protein